ncbi:TIGR03619 family F420-dependent LLM class oxidoreductase [Frankia sp. CN4]|uniref:TIGR03619 family F420-dependent LLM class oxidoreductase n=2 Tax=Frankia nepalensis TaxID=1836974 RepID=A0A937UPS8_9ACTN|nr:TIGR03619 family F420-dependent LLM class oxidoreductase [Frankia nepalensis]MBL7629383.1 TIGR03619 family F420-dependent LLM class oxidoreductase [Frankia nepalensis]
MSVVQLAAEVEARGLGSISLPEHTHIPVDSRALVEGWSVEEHYQRTLDPYIAGAFVAATTSLEIGTAVSLVAQHDAIALAKAIATLDHLSGGRVVLGVGFGYNQQEMQDHGVPVKQRFQVVEETVALMRALWTEEVASYEGRYRRLSPSLSWPKPARPGGPPVLLGGRPTERNLARIVGWADGWIPAGIGVTASVAAAVKELGVRWNDAGRAGAPEICCFLARGSRDELAREIERAAEIGVRRLSVRLEELPRDLVLPVLDDMAAALPT